MSTFNDEGRRKKSLDLPRGDSYYISTFFCLHILRPHPTLYNTLEYSLLHFHTLWNRAWLRWKENNVIFCFLVSLRECQAQPSVKYPFSRNWTTLMWFSFWTWYMLTKSFSWFLSRYLDLKKTFSNNDDWPGLPENLSKVRINNRLLRAEKKYHLKWCNAHSVILRLEYVDVYINYVLFDLHLTT